MIKKILFTMTAGILILFTAAVFVFPLPGQVPVLMYHFLGAEQNALESKNYVTARSFSRQMAFLHLLGYRVISLEDMEAIHAGKRKPKGREIAITFDDGHISFLNDAYPVLNKYRFPVTLFIISGQVRSGAADRLSENVLQSLNRENWIDIESHTVTHPVLSELSTEKIREELTVSKTELEKDFQKPIRYLAYPVGNIDERVLQEAEKAGYHLAFTTSFKKLKKLPEGPFSMPRVKISRSSDNPLVFWFKISGFYESFKRFRHTRLAAAS